MTQRSITDYDTPGTTQHDNTNPESEVITEHDSEPGTDTDTDTETNTELVHEDLPNTITWDIETETHNDATIVRAKNSTLKTLTGDASIYTHHVSYIVDGLSEYLSTTNGRTIQSPATYTDLQENFTPRITGHSCASGTGRLGITRDRLEAAIKLVTGGGSYKTSDLTIFTGGPLGFIVKYNDHAYLIETESVATRRTDTEPITAELPDRPPINGFNITEDIPQKRDQLVTLLTAIETHCDNDLASYDGMTGKSHRFTTTTGEQLSIQGNQLDTLPNELLDLEEVVGDQTITPDIGNPKTFTIPDVPTEPGNEYRLGGTVIGYDYTWRSKPGGAYNSRGASSITRISDGALAYLHTYTIRFSESPSDDNILRVRVSNNDDRVAKHTIKSGGFTTIPQYRNHLE